MDERALARLREWGGRNIREFPWRESRDPYQVAVSELMLVRTRPKQVLRIWAEFFSRFPTLESLASASEEDICRALQPLGLEWRAHRLALFAREARSRFGERLPTDPQLLTEVAGMGEYVPEATAVVVTGEGTLPVDTGIARFLNRFYGLHAKGELRRKKEILCAARKLGSCSRELFFTLVDFCVAVCMPRNPRCGTCPLNQHCAYDRKQA